MQNCVKVVLTNTYIQLENLLKIMDVLQELLEFLTSSGEDEGELEYLLPTGMKMKIVQYRD